MSQQIESVYVCSKDEWKLIPTPFGANRDAKLCASEEKLLRAEHSELERYPAVIRAKGDGAVVVDLEGIHWVPNNNDGAPLKLQVALMDGQTLIAHRDFPKPSVWATE